MGKGLKCVASSLEQLIAVCAPRRAQHTREEGVLGKLTTRGSGEDKPQYTDAGPRPSREHEVSTELFQFGTLQLIQDPIVDLLGGYVLMRQVSWGEANVTWSAGRR